MLFKFQQIWTTPREGSFKVCYNGNRSSPVLSKSKYLLYRAESGGGTTPSTLPPAHLLRITYGCPTFLPHPHREVNSLVRLLQPVMKDTQAFSLLLQTRNFLVLVPESHWFGCPCSGSMQEFPSATYCPAQRLPCPCLLLHWFGHLDSCSRLPCSGPLSWIPPFLPAQWPRHLPCVDAPSFTCPWSPAAWDCQ